MEPQAPATKDLNFSKIINESLRIFFKDAFRISLKNPSQVYFFYKTIRWQKESARLRTDWEQRGIHVPPIIIFSITNRCNLHCKGCYARAVRPSSRVEMKVSKIRNVIKEAKELGISFMVLAGGEPFVRPEILDVTKEFPEIIFLVFTNGLLLDENLLNKIKMQKNLVPVVSLEGWEEDTDARRGQGVYELLQKIITKIKRKGIFWSVSLTMTKTNFTTVTNEQFIKNLFSQGCKLFFFVEYTPIKEGTEDWLLSDEQRANVMRLIYSYRSKFPALFIGVPADEEEIGGCLSAGRGFVHISAEGDVEPCPFAPYSDANLNTVSLKDALQSEFLKAIRDNHEQLHETEGGCALWVKRAWVQSLLNETKK